MDGVHDMGGMDGFGKIEVEKNEPVFHASWEGRVLAMQRAMGYARAWHIDHSRFAQEQLPPITYLSASYYQRWVLGMEKNIIERGFATPEELKTGHAATQGETLRRKLTVSVLQDALTRPSYFRQQQVPALFKPGIAYGLETSIRRPTRDCRVTHAASSASWSGVRAATCIRIR